MKLERSALRHFLDTTFKNEAETAEWELIGDGIEEMMVELNPDVETVKDILGQSKTKDNGYEASMDADPYYADPETKLYPKLRDIALERKTGDACKTLLLEVIVEDTAAKNHLAYTQESLVKPQSYGGDVSGLSIPFNVAENGQRVKGYVSAESLKTGNPTFTPGEIPSEA
jgi:hypothetical protein